MKCKDNCIHEKNIKKLLEELLRTKSWQITDILNIVKKIKEERSKCHTPYQPSLL